MASQDFGSQIPGERSTLVFYFSECLNIFIINSWKKEQLAILVPVMAEWLI